MGSLDGSASLLRRPWGRDRLPPRWWSMPPGTTPRHKSGKISA